MRALFLAVAMLAAAPATAVTIYSETFDDPGFVGTTFDQNDTSDRFGATTYSFANDFAGWTFEASSTFLAQPVGGTDGAILLNEIGLNGGPGGSATTTVGGLTAGRTYRLGFLLSGDNEPGQDYVLNVAVDGGPATSYFGTDGDPGSTAGTQETLLFVAGGPTATLAFTQASPSAASPMIDNVIVASVPEPAAWSLMIAGFGLIGIATRGRRAPVAA